MFKRLSLFPKLKSVEDEINYNTEVDSYKRSTIKQISLILLFLDLLIVTINPFTIQRTSPKYLVSTISIFIVTAALGRLATSRFKYSSTLSMYGLIITHYFWFTENILQGDVLLNNFHCVFIGSYFQTLQLIMIICRFELKFYIPSLTSFTFYSYFRANKMSFAYPEFPIYYFIVIFLTNFLISWRVEREAIKIYEIKKKEEINHKSFKALIDEYPSAFLIAKNDKIQYFNKSCEKYFGPQNMTSSLLDKTENIEIIMTTLTPRELYIKGLESLGSEDIMEPLINFTENCLENTNLKDILKGFQKEGRKNKGMMNTCFGKNLNASQNIQFVECTISNIDWEGETAQLITISESKIYEKYLESKTENERKDKLIANVCHDLRTPLNGIMGILNLIKDLVAEKEINNLITMANHSARHLLFIINDLLDSNQLANGKFRLNFESFKIDECVRSTVEFLVFQARDKNIEINFINRLNCQAIVRSDPNRLKQVLINLIGNAIKFTEKGKVEVIIENHKKHKRNMIQNLNNSFMAEKHYWIRVKDTGCGISVEDITNLFNDFATIRNEVTSRLNKHGIGLGLSISQKIIQALNNNRKEARIKVISTMGQGSEFYFPLYSWEEESYKSFTKDENSGIFDVEISRRDIFAGQIKSQTFSFLPNTFVQSKRQRILIVDDDQINLIVLSHYLLKWESCIVEKCTDGLATIKKIKACALENIFFDAVIIDNKMPIMDGIETIREIRKLVREGFISKLAIIGASGDLASVDEFRQAGADDYISKPFSNIDLFVVLNKLLRNSK